MPSDGAFYATPTALIPLCPARDNGLGAGTPMTAPAVTPSLPVRCPPSFPTGPGHFMQPRTWTAHALDSDTEGDGPETYPRGRRCANPDCITVLSVYDPGPHCYAHTPKPRFLTTVEELRELMAS